MNFVIFFCSENPSIACNLGTTGPIQVGFSAKCTSLNEVFNQIENWKCHMCDFWLIPLDHITICSLVSMMAFHLRKQQYHFMTDNMGMVMCNALQSRDQPFCQDCSVSEANIIKKNLSYCTPPKQPWDLKKNRYSSNILKELKRENEKDDDNTYGTISSSFYYFSMRTKERKLKWC